MIAPKLENTPRYVSRGATIFKHRLYEVADAVNEVGLQAGRDFKALTDAIEDNAHDLANAMWCEKKWGLHSSDAM